MKKLIRNVLAATAFFLAASPWRPALGIGQQLISTTISTSPASTVALLLNPGESMNYTLAGTWTSGAIQLEKSSDGSNWTTIFSSGNSNAAATRSGTEYSDVTMRYRFTSSSWTSGSFVTTLKDNDDFVAQVANRKGLPIVRFNDDSLRVQDDLSLGVASVSRSTDTTSGNSLGITQTAWLAGSVDAVEGSVLIATTPVVSRGISVIVAPATLGLQSWIGVAKAATAVSNYVDIYGPGSWCLARTTGTVIPGDILGTSSKAAGHFEVTQSSMAPAGVALNNGTTAGGLTKVRLR